MLPAVEFLRSAEQIEQVRSGLPHRRPLLWLVRFDGLHIERTRHMFAAPQFNTGVYPGRLCWPDFLYPCSRHQYEKKKREVLSTLRWGVWYFSRVLRRSPLITSENMKM